MTPHKACASYLVECPWGDKQNQLNELKPPGQDSTVYRQPPPVIKELAAATVCRVQQSTYCKGNLTVGFKNERLSIARIKSFRLTFVYGPLPAKGMQKEYR
jgi:hypothetical protein